MSRSALVLLLMVAASGCHEDEPTHAVPGGNAERGRDLIAAYGCGGCHVIPGIAGASGSVGPPLDGFADRSYIAGSLRNEPAQLVRWIQWPDSVEPGTVMPSLGISEPQARDVAAYLYTLRSGGLGPPHLLPGSVLPHH